MNNFGRMDEPIWTKGVGTILSSSCISFLKCQSLASFLFIFGIFIQTLMQFLQQINVKHFMSFQYMVPGFEPFRT